MLGNFQCDDGNLINGDGCSSSCTIETCWECDYGSPTSCFIPPKYSLGYNETIMAAN